MFRKKAIIFVYVVWFLFTGYFIYAEDENPNEISNYYKKLIEVGDLNPILSLKIINENIFNIILNNLSENYLIKDYFYGIGVYINDGNNTRYFTMREYNVIKYLPEYLNSKIEFIVYSIYYYEYFFNKYQNSSFRGNPTTGRCFSVYFNENNEFVRVIHLR